MHQIPPGHGGSLRDLKQLPQFGIRRQMRDSLDRSAHSLPREIERQTDAVRSVQRHKANGPRLPGAITDQSLTQRCGVLRVKRDVHHHIAAGCARWPVLDRSLAR